MYREWLTDWKGNLRELFEPDVEELEVVSYRSSAACIEKVRYLLDHEVQAEKLAPQATGPCAITFTRNGRKDCSNHW